MSTHARPNRAGVHSGQRQLLRWLLHDWSDEESIDLEEPEESRERNARVMLVESVLPETPEFDMDKWMDVDMLVMATGKERTAREFRVLLDHARFDLEGIVATPSPLSIVIGKPRS